MSIQPALPVTTMDATAPLTKPQALEKTGLWCRLYAAFYLSLTQCCQSSWRVLLKCVCICPHKPSSSVMARHLEPNLQNVHVPGEPCKQKGHNNNCVPNVCACAYTQIHPCVQVPTCFIYLTALLISCSGYIYIYICQACHSPRVCW